MVVVTHTDASSVQQPASSAPAEEIKEHSPGVDESVEKVHPSEHPEKPADGHQESVHHEVPPAVTVANGKAEKVSDVDHQEEQRVESQPDAEAKTTVPVEEEAKNTIESSTEESIASVSHGSEESVSPVTTDKPVESIVAVSAEAEVSCAPVSDEPEESIVSVSDEPEVSEQKKVASVERSVVLEEEQVVSEPVERHVEELREEQRSVEPEEERAAVNHAPEAAPEMATNDSNEAVELPKFLYAAMEKVGSEQGFTKGQMKIEFEAGSNKGDGFVGELFKALVSEGDRHEAYLCKIPSLNETRRRQFPAMDIFDRETLAYSKLLPILGAYQEEKGVSREDGFFCIPKCFHAECDKEAEESVIVMEDLRLNGYRMWNKLLPVNYEHARLAMEQLGRLHAVSLALKRERPEEFEQFKVSDPLKVMMPAGSPFEGMMRHMIKNAMETLEPHETVELAKMQKLHDNVLAELESCSNSDAAEPHTVLGHGDCWVNNYMFRYKNGAPEKIVLLDWQLTRYATPVLDLVYFLFCSTDGEFRRRHYDEMMNIYYNSLSTLLEKLGHNAQEVFPRTALMRQLRRFGRFGVLMAVFLVPMVCTRNEDLPDMDAAAEKLREGDLGEIKHFSANTNKSAYHHRIRAVIKDTIRYGYL